MSGIFFPFCENFFIFCNKFFHKSVSNSVVNTTFEYLFQLKNCICYSQIFKLFLECSSSRTTTEITPNMFRKISELGNKSGTGEVSFML